MSYTQAEAKIVVKKSLPKKKVETKKHKLF